MKRVHFKRECWFTEEGDLEFSLSGRLCERLTLAFAPSGPDVRGMLADLQQRSKLPVAGLAAMLGVPRITARRWLDGSRTPSGAAKRLIWLLYTSLHAPELLADAEAWRQWKRNRE